MNNGYQVYFKIGSAVVALPITPSELSIKIGSNNEVVTLIDQGDINILKDPALVEVEFDARFPMRKYPYCIEWHKFPYYWDKFKELKEQKKPFRFIVSRYAGKSTNRTWDTNLLMAIEDMSLKEDAGEGDDVIISFTLKQYKEYGVRHFGGTLTASRKAGTASKGRHSDKANESQTYTVKSGDCLWNLAKKFYGNGSKYPTIYKANKTAIENDAKKHGRASSSRGHWIWPGLKLTIPKS